MDQVFLAIERNEPFENILKLLQDNFLDINLFHHGATPLLHAVEHNKIELVKDLVKHGAKCNYYNENNMKIALNFASDYQNFDMIELLIKSGADIEFKGHGESALLYCVRNNLPLAVIKCLVSNGANIHAIGKGKDNAFILSCLNNNIINVNYFLEKGINYTHINSKGYTGLDYAVKNNNVEICKLLISLGQLLDADHKKYKILIKNAIINNHPEIIELLSHTDLLESDTALFVKIELYRNDKDKLNELIEHCDFNKIDESGNSFLIHCIKNRLPIAFIENIIDKVDINYMAPNGQTALILASSMDSISLVKLLVMNGAKVNDSMDYFVSRYTNGEINYDIMILLLENGGDIDYMCNGLPILGYSIARADKELSNYLIQKGAKIDFTINGYTVLNYALFKKQIDIAIQLIDRGAKVNIISKNLSTLILACNIPKHEDIILIDKIVSGGADVNYGGDNTTDTPLIYACAYNNPHIIEYLLKAGANINYQTNTGKTALSWACENGNTNIVKILVEKGANIGLKYNNGLTLLRIAMDRGHYEIVCILIERGFDISTVISNPQLINYMIRNNKAVINKFIEGGIDSLYRIDGETPLLKYVLIHKNQDIAMMLIKKYPDMTKNIDRGTKTLLMHACSIPNVDIELIKELINPKTINNIDDDYRTALSYAVTSHNNKVAKYLISINANYIFEGEQNLLYLACTVNNTEMALYFIKKDKEHINMRNINNSTPLMFACQLNNTRLSLKLLSKGAETNVANRWGRTALFYACEKQNTEIIKKILNENCDLFQTIDFDTGTNLFRMLHHPLIIKDEDIKNIMDKIFKCRDREADYTCTICYDMEPNDTYFLCDHNTHIYHSHCLAVYWQKFPNQFDCLECFKKINLKQKYRNVVVVTPTEDDVPKDAIKVNMDIYNVIKC